jgi:hypothetical protein
MATRDLNPLEELVEELSDTYVELVYDLTETFAPFRPWWQKDLSPDQQLWRWISGTTEEGESVRDAIMGWLMVAGAFMGFQTADETLANIERIFTAPEAPDLIPPAHVASIPVELLEIIQASGPRDAANHIRKMERMVAARAEVLAQVAATDQPDIPQVPPPQPVELMPGTAGWPTFGGAPIAETSPLGLRQQGTA